MTRVRQTDLDVLIGKWKQDIQEREAEEREQHCLLHERAMAQGIHVCPCCGVALSVKGLS